jgi:autotransporter-associated beta strand protein
VKRSSTCSASRLSRATLGLLAGLLLTGAASLRAQTIVTWGSSGSGVPAGGTGNWDTTSFLWTTNNGTSYQKWTNTSKAYAIFGGTAGTVTLTAAISASRLTFDTNGYTIARTSTNVLTLVNDPFGISPKITITNAADTVTFSAPLAGTKGVYFDGAGTVILAGTNTLTSSGVGINVAGGTLKVTGSLATSNILYLGDGLESDGGGGTFILDNTGAVAAKSQTLSSLTLVAGDSIVQTNRIAAQNVTLTFSSSQFRSAGATVNYIINGGTNGTQNKIVFTGGSGFIDQGTFFGGDNFAWINSSGAWVRAIAYGTDTGATSFGAGTTIASTAHVQTTGAITAQDTATFTTLKISGAYDFTQAASSTLTVNGLLKTGGNAAVISGATLQASADAELVIRTAASTDSLTINSVIAANGTNTLTKSGPGTLTLGGLNTYTGGTVVSGGTLSVASLPSDVNAASTLGITGGLTLTTGTLSYTGGTVTMPRGVSILVGGGTINVTQAGTVLTLSSRTGGANTYVASDNLIKTGAGTLVLSGSADNDGLGLTVSAGTVVLAKDSEMYVHATGTLTINSGGTVQLAGTGGDQIYDLSTVTINAGGAFDLNGRSEGFAHLTGAGSITNTSTTAAGTLTVGQVPFGNSIPSTSVDTFSGVISDGASQSLSVVKTGAGTLILSGANTYTGSTTVSEGTLKGTLGSATALTVDTGATYSLNGASQTIGSLSGLGNVSLDTGRTLTVGGNASTTFNGNLKGAGGLIKTGAGALTLTNANTFSGGTTISFGTITTSHATALGSGAVTVRGAGARLNLSGPFIANAVTVDTGGTVTGSGGGSGAFAIGSGGILSPGTGIGTLALGSTTWAGGSTLTFQLSNTTGSAGTSWDLLSITGGLTLTATSNNRITIGLNTLDFTTGLAGAASNLNSSGTYTFAIATASSGITGFDANAFTFDRTGVVNGLTGTWSVGQSGNTLNLIYTGSLSAIPEPGTYAAVAGFAALGLAAWRKRARVSSRTNT